jgi:nucleoid DNA-binding protein
MAKVPAQAAAKAPSKSEIYAAISEDTGLSKKDVAAVFDSMGKQIEKSLGKKGSGSFALPGVCKFTVKKKPATKERPGKNPFTGEAIIIKAKPASNQIRIRPLKALKDKV